jgi:hypothetical protein
MDTGTAGRSRDRATAGLKRTDAAALSLSPRGCPAKTGRSRRPYTSRQPKADSVNSRGPNDFACAKDAITMTDQFSATGPFLWPEDRPYWMPDTLLGRVPMPSVPSSDVWDRASPTEPQAATPFVAGGGLLGSLARPKDDPNSNGGLFGNLLPAMSTSYLSPVPQAPSWDSVPTYPIAGTQFSPELPSPTAWASFGANAFGE